jgi:hypothetical protein
MTGPPDAVLLQVALGPDDAAFLADLAGLEGCPPAALARKLICQHLRRQRSARHEAAARLRARDEQEAAAGELAAALRNLRAEAGSPPLRQIAARARTVSHTTVGNLLNGAMLAPRQVVARSVAEALGGEWEPGIRRLWEATQ